jgi:hypothetical protein
MMFKFPPLQGGRAIVQVLLPWGSLYTRVEAPVHREGQTSPVQMASVMIGDSPGIRREVQRLLATEEYKHLDLRTQTPHSVAQL